MKAIILAAGQSTRLRSVVDSIPKPMIQIRGRPILEHSIELLKKQGISEIYVNLHYLADVIRGHFANGEKWGVKITYAYEKGLLGTAGAVKNFERYIGVSRFMVVYGDNYYDFDLGEIVAFHKEKKGLGTIVLYETEDIKGSGIAEVDRDGKILRFAEKPDSGEAFSRLANASIYIFEPGIFDYIPSDQLSDFGHDIFPKLIEQGKPLYGIVVKGSVIAVDTPELYKLATRGGKR